MREHPEVVPWGSLTAWRQGDPERAGDTFGNSLERAQLELCTSERRGERHLLSSNRRACGRKSKHLAGARGARHESKSSRACHYGKSPLSRSRIGRRLDMRSRRGDTAEESSSTLVRSSEQSQAKHSCRVMRWSATKVGQAAESKRIRWMCGRARLGGAARRGRRSGKARGRVRRCASSLSGLLPVSSCKSARDTLCAHPGALTSLADADLCPHRSSRMAAGGESSRRASERPRLESWPPVARLPARPRLQPQAPP